MNPAAPCRSPIALPRIAALATAMALLAIPPAQVFFIAASTSVGGTSGLFTPNTGFSTTYETPDPSLQGVTTISVADFLEQTYSYDGMVNSNAAAAPAHPSPRKISSNNVFSTCFFI